MTNVQREHDVCFGPFRLLRAERLLERDGSPLAVGGRALDVLVALIERAGEVVGHRELIARVWPDVTVEDGSLRAQVAALRKALGDGQGGARYITNVPGRGYSFVARITDTSRPNVPEVSDVSSAKRRGLPPPPTYLVGREDDVEKISRASSANRLVTLVGPGGIGKTTVAAAVGRAQLARFEDAVWFVDLGILNDADLVAGALAAALGLPVQSQNPTPMLIAYLHDKRLLLVLDGCEHMIDAVAQLAEQIIRQTPAVHILTTSREALRVTGEQVYHIQPLAGPPTSQELSAAEALRYPAAQLFVARVMAGTHGFKLRDTDAPMVAEICQRLDGIALAIELVAGRIEAYGIAKTVELLNAHLELQWRARRTALPRHQTMSAAIEWSYSLLTDLERLVLRRLAAFAGAFELKAAEHVVADGLISDSVSTEIIANLASKSLIAIETTGHHQSTRNQPRYRLFDTTRAYLLPKLFESGEADKVFERHARYWHAFLERVDSDTPQLGSEGFADHAAFLASIRAALDWSFSERGDSRLGAALAAVAAPLFLELSLMSECYDWTKRGVSALPDSARDGPEEMRLLAGLGLSSMVSRSDPDEVRSTLTRGFNIGTRLKDAYHQLRCLGALHLHMCRTSDFRGALATAQRCASVAQDMSDPAGLVMADSMLGSAHHLLGNLTSSQAHCQAALAHAPASQRMHTVYFGVDHRNRALCVLARTLWLLGLGDQALEAANFTLDEGGSIEHPASLGVAFWTVPVFIWAGQLDRAEAIIDRLLVHARKFSLQPYHAMALGQRGAIAIRRGDPAHGVALLDESLQVARRVGYLMVATSYMIDMAEGLIALRRTREALATLDQATARVEASDELYLMPELLRTRGEALAQAGASEGQRTVLAAIDWARRQSAMTLEIRAMTSLARMQLERGDAEEAAEALATLHGRFSEGGGNPDVRAAVELLEALGRSVGPPA